MDLPETTRRLNELGYAQVFPAIVEGEPVDLFRFAKQELIAPRGAVPITYLGEFYCAKWDQVLEAQHG